MLEDILKYIKEVKEVDFDPELKNRFNNALVKNWRVKANNRIDAMFGKKSIFSRAKISTSSIVSDSLFLDCSMKNELTLSPVVSLKRCSVYSTEGRVDIINRSFVKNSDLEVIGTCQRTTFENCILNRGSYIECKFINCSVRNGNIENSLLDNDTLTKSTEGNKFNNIKVI